MRRSLTTALLGVAALSSVLWWFLERRTTRSALLKDEPAAIAVAPVEKAMATPIDVREPAPAAPEPEQSARTARSFLADYWGARWQEIEPEMRAHVDIDVPFDFVPWEEAQDQLAPLIIPQGDVLEGQIRGQTEWPVDLTCGWLSEYLLVNGRLAPTEADLPLIQEIARPYNEQLEVLARDWGRRLEWNVSSKWERGDFVKAPFSTYGVDDSSGFFFVTAAGHGWAANLVLTEQDCPDMVTLMDEMGDLADQRNREIRSYLKQR